MNKVELTETVDRLTDLIRNDRSKVDTQLAQEGEALLAIFTDDIMAKKGRNFAECREVAIRDAIEDLANGGQVLAGGAIGVKYDEGSLSPFVQMNTDSAQLNTAFSIRMKKTAAFKAWRSGETVEIPQDQLNACVYFLITQLA